jgi:hypothetical protein
MKGMFVLSRVFVAFVALTAVGTVVAATTETKAADIRYFVSQSTGLFEIKGTTGGRFITQPTNEFIHVPGRGDIRVVGYTDRAARNESVVIQVRGSGLAWIWVTRTTNGVVRNILSPFREWLPKVVPIVVPSDVNFDNITGYVNENGYVISRRLPIGTRP